MAVKNKNKKCAIVNAMVSTITQPQKEKERERESWLVCLDRQETIIATVLVTLEETNTTVL